MNVCDNLRDTKCTNTYGDTYTALIIRSGWISAGGMVTKCIAIRSTANTVQFVPCDTVVSTMRPTLIFTHSHQITLKFDDSRFDSLITKKVFTICMYHVANDYHYVCMDWFLLWEICARTWNRCQTLLFTLLRCIYWGDTKKTRAQ